MQPGHPGMKKIFFDCVWFKIKMNGPCIKTGVFLKNKWRINIKLSLPPFTAGTDKKSLVNASVCKYKFTYQHLNQIISTFHLDGMSSNNPALVTSERKLVLRENYYWRMQFIQTTQMFKHKLKGIKRALIKWDQI